ncbi:hypothetical protein EIP91_011745 [Steccherinum ochraceum]|uniref:FAD-binding domain-containing protein n=1 Tax=Steccherinum ochraceum TaxID=92696 RepID=A0A4R0RTK0_9APHY|nr:hypothetical protein EIP91_011745 [Steccherinum ochraceum]
MSGPSSPASSERSLHHALLSIHFIIVGGGASGLCAALSLTRIGHKVTLLEQDETFEQATQSGGCIIPPNTVKLLSRWGIRDELFVMSNEMPGMYLTKYDTDEDMGTHVWDQEFFKEIGGSIRTINYGALRKLLCKAVVDQGVSPLVTLESGETLRADVVLGADGQDSVVRKLLLQSEEIEEDVHKYLGRDVYSVFVPGESMLGDPDLEKLFQESLFHSVLGDGRAMYAYRIPPPPDSGRKVDDYALNMFLPGEEAGPRWEPIENSVLLDRMGNCWDRWRKLVQRATMIAKSPMTERPLLDVWVHEHGRVLVIGDAAHVFYPCSIQNTGVAVCDAATLAQLYQHLHHHRQINVFLNAFQDIRPARIKYMRALEFGNLNYQMMSYGPEQEQRDKALRERKRKGLNALESDSEEEDAVMGTNITSRWESALSTFAFDAEEEADKWWADWGSLQERAAFSNINTHLSIEVQHVEQTIEAPNSP